MTRLTSFVKAYDVRGLVGIQLTSDASRAIGYAFARFVAGKSPAVVIAYDMRESSPELAGAFAEGVTSAGLDVVMAGPGLHRPAVFRLRQADLPGAMFTASHNPARYNGIKMCLAGAVPISLDTGLAQVRDEAQAMLDGAGRARRPARHRHRAEPADRVRRLSPVAGRPDRDPAAARRGRRRQRDGRLHRARGLRRACRCASRSCTSSSTAASPTTRRTRWSRPTWSTCSRRSGGPVPTSGWPSTATPTAASSSTSAANRSRPARSPRLVATRELRRASRARRFCTT